MIIGYCSGTDRFNNKTRKPEAKIVVKGEYIHTCPVGKHMRSIIRLQDALLTPLKQLQVIWGGGMLKAMKSA